MRSWRAAAWRRRPRSSAWLTRRAPAGGPEPGRRESTMTDRAPIAVALDAPDLDTAAHWAAPVRGGRGAAVFLDLKLHDIPATVAGAARSVSRVRPDLLTVHAAAGPA